MGIIELLLVGVSLAMDATAVSICKGLSMKKLSGKKAMIIALYFGIFQALMPAIGYVLGVSFKNFVESIDHWIAFILLLVIGVNMIVETLKSDNETSNDKVDFKTMLPLAIATSIDALAVGITLAFLNVNFILAIISFGLITFALSILGVIIGHKFGSKYGNIANIVGGIILILIGTKILLEHLGII